jgi:glycosyltransferase involved in cell wall biosynthesis
VGNGIDPNVFNPENLLCSASAERPSLLTVGHLLESKGQQLVLKVMPRLLRQYPDLIYNVIGTGPYESELKSLSARLNLLDYVQFHGYFPNERLPPWYAGSDVYVMPSSSEGFGIVYLESLAMGTPVIGCQGQGLEDFVEEGTHGFLVPSDDMESLGDALLAALARDWSADMLIAYAQRFTWERSARELEQVFRRILVPSGS